MDKIFKIPVFLPLRTVNTINELNSLGSSLRRNKKCQRQTYVRDEQHRNSQLLYTKPTFQFESN